MKLKIIFATLFLFFNTYTFSQTNFKISGKIKENVSKTPLIKASATVLNQRDSNIVKFGWSNLTGDFLLSNIPKGDFILLVSYPGYADYVEKFSIDATQTTKNFNSIILITKALLLNEVIVKGQHTMLKIKGDTLEFDSKAFKIEPNAKVEDMLKQIPGMQVDRNGKITAYGQQIEKVLLDGEEFFGDDPTLITKNIRADMVDKIQLYDKPSTIAATTGINDGNSKKTLNIKLKEDKKKGLFGKISAGLGTNKFYQEQAMLNIFNPKRKIAVFANTANTGRVGLTQSDNNKYGFAAQSFEIFGGGILSSFVGATYNEFSNERYNGQGIPSAITAGVHLDQKFNKDKQYLNTNYLYGSLDVKGQLNNLNRNQVANAIQTNNTDRSFNNDAFNHHFNASYRINLDSLSTLEITLGTNIKKNENKNSFISSTASSIDGALFNSNRLVSNNANLFDFGSSALYTTKFKKPRRTLSLLINQYTYTNLAKGYLDVSTNFLNSNNTIDSTQQISQFKQNEVKSNLLSGTLSFSESISKSFSTVLSYGIGINSSSAIRESFNKAKDGEYRDLDQIFSNDYTFRETANRFGSSLVFNKKNIYTTLGLAANVFSFEQLDQTVNQKFKKNYTNLSPSIMFRNSYPQRGFLTLAYSGKPIQPSIEQTQPIRSNEDPLNIRIGNPELRPSFLNRFNAIYLIAKPSGGRNFNFNIIYTTTTNPFVNSSIINASGETQFQTVNLRSKSVQNFSASTGYSKNIKKKDLTLSFELRYNFNNYYGFTNKELLESRLNVFGAKLSSTIYKTNKYILDFNLRPSYNQSTSSQNAQLDNSGFTMDADAYLNITLTKTLSFTTTTSYSYQAKTKVFDTSNQIVLLNMVLSKSFFKDKSLRASISGNDLLNQNIGFNRSVLGSYLNETTYTTIKRYMIFSLAWDFSKFGKSLN